MIELVKINKKDTFAEEIESDISIESDKDNIEQLHRK